ncbi:MAG TPA: exodeoxyribonuclease VII small subunit [Limnochordales bacterium]
MSSQPDETPVRPEDEVEALPFEEALARLERAVLALESGELSLEQALATYEEGVRMARVCARRLEQAEQRLAVLAEESGRVVLRPFEPTRASEGHG